MMVPAPEPDLHHGVLERINAGFCVIQVLFDGDEAVDYRFLEVNEAFERHTGLKDAYKSLAEALAGGTPSARSTVEIALISGVIWRRSWPSM